MATTSPETAVRNYLTYLSNPDSLIDRSALQKLENEAEKAKDPIDKLMALARLENARSADPAIYREGFVESAKAWAEAEGVPARAFERMGVPADALRDAGLVAKGRRARGRAGTKEKATRVRRASLRPEQLEAGILSLGEPFSVRDVADKIGGSPPTVKAAVERLEAQGRIMPAGERSRGRGRASKVWTVAVEPL